MIAVFGADGVLGVDVGVAGVDGGGGDVVFEGLGVAGADLLAKGNFLVAEVGEFGLNDGGLKAIAAAVGAEGVVRFALFAAVVGDGAQGFGEVWVFCKYGTAVAVAAEWFGGEETGGRHGAHGAGFASVLFGTEALRGVFDDFKAVFFSDGFQGGVVSHLAEEVDGDDGFGLGGDGLLNFVWIDVVGVGFDVGEDGGGPDEGDGRCTTDPGEGGGDHFVTGANTERTEGYLKRHGAAGYSNAIDWGIGGAKEVAEGGLQLVNFGAVDVAAVLHDRRHGGVDLLRALSVDGFDVDKLHGVCGWNATIVFGRATWRDVRERF